MPTIDPIAPVGPTVWDGVPVPESTMPDIKSVNGNWQAIAGGGEGQETPLEAARREVQEEGGIPRGLRCGN